MTSDASYVGMVSADGVWRWDGANWIPNVSTAAADRRMPGQFLPSWLIVTACVLLVVFAFGVLAVVTSSSGDAEAERNVNEIMCERWAEADDPDC